jgi:hypothetical protein
VTRAGSVTIEGMRNPSKRKRDGERPYALAVDGTGNLYAGSNFTTAGGVGANNIAKWDGTVWSPVGTGTNGVVLALAGHATGIYAGGYFTSAGGAGANNVAKWDGGSWSPLGTGVDDAVRALALDDAGGLYVGGFFFNAGGVSARRILSEGSRFRRGRIRHEAK